ncbi:MAG TPA: PQQ-binding-like beta-propeller repeat protein [Ktedonobacterales bacterium]|nr:PQQ-binding-like beta-propeller repeat protein [Ktedonobacterales bacterium]
MQRGQAKWVTLILTGLCVMLAGCGSSAVSQRPAATTTTAPLPTATATPTPSPTIYVAGQATSSDGSTTSNTVYALNSANGTVRWSKALGSASALYVAAAGADVYVTDESASIIALSPADGRQLWQVKSAHGDSNLPVVDTSALYLASEGESATDAYVDAYSSTDGKILWERDLGANLSPNLTIAGEMLYIDSTGIGSQTTLTALRTTDGSVAWTTSVPWIASTPTVIGDTVYLNEVGNVRAYDSANGSLKWSYTPPSQNSMGDSTVSGAAGLIFAGDSALLIALHSANGTVAWTSPLSAIFYGTSAYNNVVYVSSGTSLVALDAATGARKWSATLSGGDGYAPTLSNGALFETRSVGASQQPEGYIYALNPANGSVLWEFTHPHEFYTNLAMM